MTEEINIDENNLCTTEEAFESFQARSFSEEDDFITLSDILPPQPQLPDLSSTMNEMPSENDIFPLTLEDKQTDMHHLSDLFAEVNEVEVTTTDYISDAVKDGINIDARTSHDLVESTTDKPPPRRRGRKKKMEVDQLVALDSSQNQSTVLNQSQKKKRGRKPFQKNFVHDHKKTRKCNTVTNKLIKQKGIVDLPSVKRGKKGRKIKKLLYENEKNEPIPDDIKLPLDDTPKLSKESPKTRKRDYASIVTSEENLQDSENVKKRGRPKSKQVIGNKVVDEDIIQNEKNLNNENIKKQCRPRNKKIDKTLEDSNDNVDEDITLCNLIQNNEKVKKRGRSKKKQIEEPLDDVDLNVVDDEDDLEEISLSKLKQVCNDTNLVTNTDETLGDEITENSISQLDGGIVTSNTINMSDVKEQDVMNTVSSSDLAVSEPGNIIISSKRNTKMPVMSDFEYNIDTVLKENTDMEEKLTDNGVDDTIEDPSKRPTRRKARKRYEIESDEDPFANMESSDDEPRRGKKGYRYNSDHEYKPGNKRGQEQSSDYSDSVVEDDIEENQSIKPKRKRLSKTAKMKKNVNINQSPLVNSSEVTENVSLEDDIEASLQPTVITPGKAVKSWSMSHEFENFLAKKIQGSDLKIKKTSTKKNIAPLEIPVLNPNEPKKTTDMCAQTDIFPTSSSSTQTDTPYSVPMKDNVALTLEQSQNACEFLKNIVATTVELGQLMITKSEDFIKKKINTEHVVDTMKMDYCVNKSFLLFKLAKHNLSQMEQDLAKQYEDFLKTNNLSSCREKERQIIPKATKDDDSDCEIVEVPVQSKKQKPKFTPKTVFLNKELSIKIAKKNEEVKFSPKEKINVKGRHTVWISDSVMVKKVKPTQSFLAQDSRNKKPPDTYVSLKMVKDFFDSYYRQQTLQICAPFIARDWLATEQNYICSYFFVNLEKVVSNSTIPNNNLNVNSSENNPTKNMLSNMNRCENMEKTNPKTLFSLCTEVIQKQMKIIDVKSINSKSISNTINKLYSDLTLMQPKSLLHLSLNIFRKYSVDSKSFANTSCDLDRKLLIMQPKSLLHLSLNTLCKTGVISHNTKSLKLPAPAAALRCDAKSLKHFDEIAYPDKEKSNEFFSKLNLLPHIEQRNNDPCIEINNTSLIPSNTSNKCEIVQSLLSICVKYIQKQMYKSKKTECMVKKVLNNPVSLTQITFNSVVKLLYDLDLNKYTKLESNNYCNIENEVSNNENAKKFVSNNNKSNQDANVIYKNISDSENEKIFCNINHSCQDANMKGKYTPNRENRNSMLVEALMIDTVNTVSEETFLNMEESSLDYVDNTQYEEDDNLDYNCEEFEPDTDNFEEDELLENNSWASQVKLQELKSCSTSSKQNVTTKEKEVTSKDRIAVAEENSSTITQIKVEPVEITETVDALPIVKSEPLHNLDEMTVIPDAVLTKTENADVIESVCDENIRQSSAIYDGNRFEAFVRSNKMMYALNEANENSEIFSQSGLRVRRQYDPDPEEETGETDMSLLIPQMYEPLNVETVKGTLMKSSSDEEENGVTKITKDKKKLEKRPRGRPKKNDKSQKEPIKNKEKLSTISDVAMITRKMRERIRQEEKKIESSDSENDNITLSKRKDKGADTKNAPKDKAEEEIQCNNVDSTERIGDSKYTDKNERNVFTGFTAVDQNEMASYQKYIKYVYDQILPKTSEDSISTEQNTSKPNTSEEDNNKSPLNENSCEDHTFDMNPNEPSEMIECEPTLPFFDIVCEKDHSNKTKTAKNIKKQDDLQDINKNIQEKEERTYIVRHGWHCYSVDSNDQKLYRQVEINLRKLPESFVDTYLKYQGIVDRDKEDDEVDKLINLQSLNRGSNRESSRRGVKNKTTSDDQPNSPHSSRTVSVASDYGYELTASEDEGGDVADEAAPPVQAQAIENCLAKNSLMNDKDSDEENNAIVIKEKTEDDPSKKVKQRGRPKRYKDKEKEVENSDALMLTADKMMNKELQQLHAPIVLASGNLNSTLKKSPLESKKKINKTFHMTRERTKSDGESSEEEKQWVNTKEKLLKKMGKKQCDTSVDDAKRARLVSEFIERRKAAPEPRKLYNGVRGPRNRKKFLEKQKQLSALSKELYGESSTSHGGKKYSYAYFKGRRNIRKVLDKKSLAKRTVVANMEEFERKRRLHTRQNKLREILGYEEDVNVVVINDEVCLEYDFEAFRPIVTVHPFFTKVMKAHQYEGVKFMWDACFESLAMVEAGHGGGGCILAHCMGLGKTLQVLALLHTVLTHPRLGIQRVLVCCPLSTVLNWVDEIHKWIGPVTDKIKVFELSKLKKTYERAYQLEDWYKGGGIFIIGYELFRSLTTLDPEVDNVKIPIYEKIRMALLDPGPDIIVCDEGHLLKNDTSVLALAMSRVATKRRIVLTGTPMQNNLREYYCMVDFVKPNLLGTYKEYSNRFENPIMNGQHRDSQEEDIKLMKARTHILHKVLEGCLQRQEASVLYPYLPKKHEYTVFISLTKCQSDLYRHYLKNCANRSKQSVLRDFHTLQKIWSHPQVLHHFQIKTRDVAKVKAEKEDDLAHEDLGAREDMKPGETEVWWLQYLDGGSMLDTLDSSNKFVAVFRILDECVALGDKVLIFSTSLFTLDALEYFLKSINKWSLGQEYYRLDGSVPPEVRQKWCREFNAENNVDTKLFLISTRAGSLGLNMTAANRVIILDTSWNPAHDIQSIFRVYRFGQKKDCYIYRLVALGTMEQKIYERAVTKQAVACRVVDEQQIDRHYNLADLTELYRFDELGTGVAGGVAVGVCDVVLLRVARDAALHAVHEHDSLLRGSSEQGLPEHERAAAWMQFQQEHSHKDVPNPVIPSESKVVKVEIPKQDEDFLPPPSAKPKKGKKKSVDGTAPVDSINAPEASDEVITSDLGAPNDHLVDKITDILIKHNIQSQQFGAKETSMLIQNVRLCISTGQMHHLDKSDELTRSIAKILVAQYKAPGERAAMGTPVVAESVSEAGPRKPLKRLSPDEDEETTSLAKFPESVPATEPPAPSRKKRKAALAAEKSFDTLAKESVINLDDDDWDRNFDEADYHPKKDSSPVPPAKTKTSQKPTPTASKRQNETVSSMEMDSIMLSDDDEPTLVETEKKPLILDKVSEKSQPVRTYETKARNAQKRTTKTVDAVIKATADGKMAAADDEVVPLHKSLLTNNNFIKIVAHTYLAGNSLLDEDAATLAARYSTHKALEEVEKTGNSLVEGPIYDIAVKVLGKDVLKQLNRSNVKVIDTDKVKSENKRATEPIESFSDSSAATKAVEAPVGAKKKVVGPVRRRTIMDIKVTAGGPAPAATPPPPAVVPVRLIQRLVNAPSSSAGTGETQLCGATSRDECILPDDDEVRVVDLLEPQPPAQPAHSAAPAPPPSAVVSVSRKQIILAKTNVNLVGNNDNMTEKKNTANAPPSMPTIKIVKGMIVREEHKVPPKKPPVILNNADTICLDSDEEDAAAPVHAAVGALNEQRFQVIPQTPESDVPYPVPVSLTAANSSTFVPAHNFSNFVQMNHVPNTHTNVVANPQMNFGPDSQLNIDQNSQLAFVQNPQLTYISSSELTYGENSQINSTPGQKEFIIIPAKNLTKLKKLPKSVMTTAVSKTPVADSFALSTTPTLLNSTTPKVTPKIASKVVPKIASKVVPKIAPKITPNILSKPGPAMANVTNVNDAMATTNKMYCQLGDIVRIGKNGSIEILNRGSADAPLTQAVADPITISDDVESTPAVAPVAGAPVEVTGVADAAAHAEPSTSEGDAPVLLEDAGGRRSRSASSSSSSSGGSSRSSSPHNPLSILKDVVHIRAANYERPKKKKLKPTQPLTKTNSNSSNAVAFNTSTSSGKTPSCSGPLSREVHNKPLPSSTFVKRTISVSQSESKAGDVSRKSNVAMNTKTSTSIRRNIAMSSGSTDYIDLTDLMPSQSKSKANAPSTSLKTNNLTKKTLATAVGASKATVGTSKAAVGTSKAAVGTTKTAVGISKTTVGTSKTTVGTSKTTVGTSKSAIGPYTAAVAGSSRNIFLQSDGALTKGASKERAGPSQLVSPNLLNKMKNTVSMKLNNFASKTKHKVETNKRPSPSLSTETNAAKKKKIRPMTLEDFDLDDIDVDLGDIIELE